MPAALEDVRIVDFSHIAAGPSCTQLLADLGADVIKVERLGTGELSRGSAGFGFTRGQSNLFLALNRSKRSITVDLQNPQGKAIIYKLAERSDVVVQNFRAGVMDRLGLGYGKLREMNARLIYASVSGYGLTGPYTFKGGQDLIAQAMGGIISVTGHPDGPPTQVGASPADYYAGLLLAQGITAALYAREKTGVGQELDVALVDTQLCLNIDKFTGYLNTGVLPGREIRPLYGIYRTRDGWMALNGGRNFAGVCQVLGLGDLPKDPRFDTWEKVQRTNVRELRAILEQAIAEWHTADLVKALEAQDILCGPVNDYAAVANDPQILHNKMIVDVPHPTGGTYRAVGTAVRLSGTPGTVRQSPPLLGQHNAEVLTWLGYTPEEIAALRAQKVIGQEDLAPERK